MILKFVRCISIPAKIIRYPGRWHVFSRARMENLPRYVLEVLKLLLNHVCVFHNFIRFLCEFLFLLDNVLIFYFLFLGR